MTDSLTNEREINRNAERQFVDEKIYEKKIN